MRARRAGRLMPWCPILERRRCAAPRDAHAPRAGLIAEAARRLAPVASAPQYKQLLCDLIVQVRGTAMRLALACGQQHAQRLPGSASQRVTRAARRGDCAHGPPSTTA